jgi:hypothetical protein
MSIDVEDENDNKQAIRLFDDEEVVLVEAAAAFLADRVSATIEL